MDLSLTQPVNASVQDLWRACSEPSGLASWQADQVDGQMIPGRSVVMRWPALGASLHLDVLEVTPTERVVLGTGKLRVVLELEAGQLRLTHSPLEEDDDRDGFASSWRLALATLKHYLERHPGQQRSTHWWVRPLPTTAATAHVFFTDPHALGAWLTRESSPLLQGERFRHLLFEGSSMSGVVCSLNEGRDLALSWEEQDDSLLCLRTLPSPRSDEERLVALAWSHWADEPRNVQPVLDVLGVAFDRLVRTLEQPATA